VFIRLPSLVIREGEPVGAGRLSRRLIDDLCKREFMAETVRVVGRLIDAHDRQAIPHADLLRYFQDAINRSQTGGGGDSSISKECEAIFRSAINHMKKIQLIMATRTSKTTTPLPKLVEQHLMSAELEPK